MLGKIIGWGLRLGAWGCLMAVIARLALQPTQAWLNGRIFQIQVLFESRGAADALFHELGLDHHFDFTCFRIHPQWVFTAPCWLPLRDRRQEGQYEQWGPYIWLESDGTYVLPPFAAYPLTQDDLPIAPRHVHLRARNGQLLHAAIVNFEGWTPQPVEHTVWVHQGDRWVNVVRVEGEGVLEPPEGDDDHPISLIYYTDASAKIEFRWDEKRQALDMPTTLPAEVRLLKPLPDQSQVFWPPTRLITHSALDPFIENTDFDGLREYYAAASAEYGREIRIPEHLLNEMGYQLLSNDRVADAIRVFKYAVELYPNSANTYDSLGDAYQESGQLELAKSSYEQACEQGRKTNDPDLPVYTQNLDRLKAKLRGE